MDKHVNLTAYDDVENLANFTYEEFISYCEDKIKSCNKHISFIKNLKIKNHTLEVFEIGSGNSKLLYALEKAEILENGYGVEISPSRHLFAQKFKEYINSKKVTNLNKNIFDIEDIGKFDLIIAVDIVLQLISPISIDAEKNLMNWIQNNLKEDGYVIFELWSFSKILEQLALSNNDMNIWKEFPSSDPFKYILSSIKQDDAGNLQWNKTFIKRASFEESKFHNVLKPYSKEQIITLLKEYGFKEIKLFDYWADVDDCEDDEYIVIAKK